MKWTRRAFVAAVGASGLTVVAGVRAAAPIRIATEYPERSHVGKVLLSAVRSLRDRTGLVASVAFDQPDPDLLVRQLQQGRLDGALLGADALRQLAPRLVSCHTPGHFGDTRTLAAYRSRHAGTIRSQIEASGALRFAGHAHLMQRQILSRRPIHLPVDLQRWRVLVRPGDVMAEAARKRLGLSPVQAAPHDWRERLASGKADGVFASAYEAVRWNLVPHLTHMHDIPWGGAVGVMCLARRTLARLSSNEGSALVATCEKAGAILADRLFAEDAEALKRLRASLSSTRSGSRQQRIWSRHFELIAQSLPAVYRPPTGSAPVRSSSRRRSSRFKIDLRSPTNSIR